MELFIGVFVLSILLGSVVWGAILINYYETEKLKPNKFNTEDLIKRPPLLKCKR